MSEIDEAIHVVEYDASWIQSFGAERVRIETVLAIPSDRVEHIGGTAVPGLLAKPVIDIMVGVDEWPPARVISGAICGLGYEALGEAGVPQRLYFRKRGSIDFNVHVVRFGGQQWRSNIALRNYLRSVEAARERYAETKRNAVSSGAVTLLAYSAAKAAVVSQLVQEALTHEKTG